MMKRRQLSRWPVPSPDAVTSASGTPHAESTASAASLLKLTICASGIGPMRSCFQSRGGAATRPSPPPSAVVGTNVARPFNPAKSVLNAASLSSLPGPVIAAGSGITRPTAPPASSLSRASVFAARVPASRAHPSGPIPSHGRAGSTRVPAMQDRGGRTKAGDVPARSELVDTVEPRSLIKPAPNIP